MMNDGRDKDLLNKILKQTEKTQECIVGLDKKLDLHVQKTDIELKHISELDREQNRILEEHHNRSIQLEKDNILREQGLRQEFDQKIESGKEEIESRLVAIESPGKWLSTTLKLIFKVGLGAGTVFAFYQVASHWTEIAALLSKIM